MQASPAANSTKPQPVLWKDASLPAPAPAAATQRGSSVATDLIYDLRTDEGSFQADVEAFSARFKAEAEARAGALLDCYMEHLRRTADLPRSRGEYAIELLTLGMALGLYLGTATRMSSRAIAAARALLGLRRRSPRFKHAADRLRAWLFRNAAPSPEDFAPDVPDLRRLPRLVAWMRASGEFEQEAARLEHWLLFLRAFSAADRSRCLKAACDLFAWFARESAAALGRYTCGVSRFLRTEYARRGRREDQLFCGRPPVEYHLGMVAAEIMNQGLRAEFEGTPRKAVLLPACMRGAKAATCRALLRGVDMTCAGCDPGCAVFRITRRMRRLGVPVYIVPHASGFSRWLERWQREHDVGVVAVACLLNILAGGYEMRARGIASQCVLLDFPGCEKHWRSGPLSTCVDEDRLVQIATAHPASAVSTCRSDVCPG